MRFCTAGSVGWMAAVLLSCGAAPPGPPRSESAPAHSAATPIAVAQPPTPVHPTTDAGATRSSTASKHPFVAMEQRGGLLVVTASYGCLINVVTLQGRKAQQLVACGGPPVTDAEVSVDVVVIPADRDPFLCRGSLLEKECRSWFLTLGRTDDRGRLEVDIDKLLPLDLAAENPVVGVIPPAPPSLNNPRPPGPPKAYRVVEVTHSRPLQKPEAFIDVGAVATARDDRVWAAAEPERCIAAKTEDACDKVIGYVADFPKGRHREDAGAAYDKGVPAVTAMKERRVFGALDVKACSSSKAPSGDKVDEACAPLKQYMTEFPEGAHAKEVAAAVEAGTKRAEALREAEARNAEQRTKACFAACFKRCLTGRPQTRASQLDCVNACTTFPPEAVCNMR